MINQNKIDIISEKIYNRYNKYNTKVLKELGSVINKFSTIEIDEAYSLEEELYNSTIINQLLNELNEIDKKTKKDMDTLCEIVALSYLNSYKKYYKDKNIKFINYKDDKKINKQINKIVKNIPKSKNIGFVYEDEKGKKVYNDLRKTYNNLIDKAVKEVSTGKMDYQSAMRKISKQLADSGVNIHKTKLGYKSGYNRRLDSSIRQSVLDGVRDVNKAMRDKIAKELKTDGVEVSAHELCAEDHLEIQGRIFSNEEFEKENGELARHIGEYNCKHDVIPVILGVNTPSYTDEMLEQYKEESLSKVEYRGKTYTKYEATQIQRRLETEIRKQKDRQIISKASNDKIEVGKAQQKITQLTTEYSNFSKNAGLNTYKERLSVSGYRRVKVD
jgi:hypothetical protein